MRKNPDQTKHASLEKLKIPTCDSGISLIEEIGMIYAYTEWVVNVVSAAFLSASQKLRFAKMPIKQINND